MNDHGKRAGLQAQALGKVTQGRCRGMERGQCFLNTDEGNSLKRQSPAKNWCGRGKIIDRFVGQQSVAIIQIKQPELLRHSARHHPGKIATKLVPAPETGTQPVFCKSQTICEYRGETQEQQCLITHTQRPQFLGRGSEDGRKTPKSLQERLCQGFGIASGYAAEKQHFQNLVIRQCVSPCAHHAMTHALAMTVRPHTAKQVLAFRRK